FFRLAAVCVSFLGRNEAGLPFRGSFAKRQASFAVLIDHALRAVWSCGRWAASAVAPITKTIAARLSITLTPCHMPKAARADRISVRCASVGSLARRYASVA